MYVTIKAPYELLMILCPYVSSAFINQDILVTADLLGICWQGNGGGGGGIEGFDGTASEVVSSFGTRDVSDCTCDKIFFVSVSLVL